MLPINEIKKRTKPYETYKLQVNKSEEIKGSLYQLAELMVEMYLKGKRKKNVNKI